jgi:hypothetical protein
MKDSRSKRWGQCEQAAAPLQAQSNSTLGDSVRRGPVNHKERSGAQDSFAQPKIFLFRVDRPSCKRGHAPN